MAKADSKPIDLPEITRQSTKVCRQYLEGYNAEIKSRILRGDSGLAVAARRASVLDGLLSTLFCAAEGMCRFHNLAPKGRVALVAVGGYGRGLVAPFSDADVIFLCDDPADPHMAQLTDGVIYPLWDLGVDIGHVVRGVQETIDLAKEDIRTATTLVDLRWLAGDPALVQDLTKRGKTEVLKTGLVPFLDSLEQERTARHAKYGESVFLLEPEVKLSRGGLRDLDIAIWAARARFKIERRADLVTLGALLRRELKELQEAEEMLWKVRNWLHTRAGRKQDRLTFSDQEEIADAFGYVDGLQLAVEQLMQAYYKKTQVVALTCERMLDRVRPPLKKRQGSDIREFEDGTLLFNDEVTLKNSKELAVKPELALLFYKRVVRSGMRPYWYARDAIARICVEKNWQKKIQESPWAAALFLKLLLHVGTDTVKTGSILMELHEIGLIAAFIPEFRALMGRSEHDAFRVYTTDVHCVKAVDKLKSIMCGDFAPQYSLASRLAAETPRPATLFLALLLHEIGKPYARKYEDKSAELVKKISMRIGFSEEDISHMGWLVEHQMSFYKWATQRDISDPETIQEVVEQIGTQERLKDIFLFTMADQMATNPQAITPWKYRMLEELYFRVTDALKSQEVVSIEKRSDRIREKVLAAFDSDHTKIQNFLEGMPGRYFLANSVDAIVRHIHVILQNQDQDLIVAASDDDGDDIIELQVVAKDKPGLLADIATILAMNNLSIMDAQVHFWQKSPTEKIAMDIFHVRKRAQVDTPLKKAQLAHIERDLRAHTENRESMEEISSRHSRPPSWMERRGPKVPTEVVVDNEVSGNFTIVDVYTQDRIGLLGMIAKTLYRLETMIAVSKVNTEGNRVSDVFYITEMNGEKIVDAKRLSEISSTLKSAVEHFQQEEALLYQ